MSEIGKIEQTLEKISREPNHEKFQYKGYDCLIRRNMQSGILCGYVAIPKDHPLYDKVYDDIGIEVHGGLTWFEEIHGEGDGIKYLGFDCGHWNDMMPFYHLLGHNYTSIIEHEEAITYKDIEYVRNEVKSMVDQLVATGG